ncbi:MAG: hypothetical protein ABIR17_03355 [Pseudolysinimonas sp.]|uniref:hypothetical protein n=1 Tax=Pseudolysinimonas sp. TaxID=2680009 RepID=UPI0032634C15
MDDQRLLFEREISPTGALIVVGYLAWVISAIVGLNILGGFLTFLPGAGVFALSFVPWLIQRSNRRRRVAVLLKKTAPETAVVALTDIPIYTRPELFIERAPEGLLFFKAAEPSRRLLFEWESLTRVRVVAFPPALRIAFTDGRELRLRVVVRRFFGPSPSQLDSVKKWIEGTAAFPEFLRLEPAPRGATAPQP